MKIVVIAASAMLTRPERKIPRDPSLIAGD
jgi:hypothetical protein